MRNLSAVAEQLRQVRQARKKFLRLWAMEQSIIFPALDQMAADVQASPFPPGFANVYQPLNGSPSMDDN